MYLSHQTLLLVLILSVICELHQHSEVSGNNVKEANNQRDVMIQQFKLH